MISLNQHPLLMQTYKLMLKVEELPGGIEQTELVTKLSDWNTDLSVYLQKHDLLSDA